MTNDFIPYIEVSTGVEELDRRYVTEDNIFCHENQEYTPLLTGTFFHPKLNWTEKYPIAN